MRILLQTRFAPSIGGIETLAMGLVRDWRNLGAAVSVSTDVVAHPDGAVRPYPLHYRPSVGTLINLWCDHDVVVQMNVSLKAVWPMLLTRTPVVLVHHGPYWIDREGTRDWRERFKLRIARRSRWNICVSRFVREATGLTDARVIPNCYDDHVFRRDDACPRDKQVAFVGRLVSDKGADLLLSALARIPDAANWRVTFIGDGPERNVLETQARELRLTGVRFTGSLPPEAVAAELRKHLALVVPSLVPEAFGIVALEGLACGCVPLVSNGGGLPEAIGNAGKVFRRGDVEDLAHQLKTLLDTPEERAMLVSRAQSHLARHTAAGMAEAYLEVIRTAVATYGKQLRKRLL